MSEKTREDGSPPTSSGGIWTRHSALEVKLRCYVPGMGVDEAVSGVVIAKSIASFRKLGVQKVTVRRHYVHVTITPNADDLTLGHLRSMKTELESNLAQLVVDTNAIARSR